MTTKWNALRRLIEDRLIDGIASGQWVLEVMTSLDREEPTANKGIIDLVREFEAATRMPDGIAGRQFGIPAEHAADRLFAALDREGPDALPPHDGVPCPHEAECCHVQWIERQAARYGWGPHHSRPPHSFVERVLPAAPLPSREACEAVLAWINAQWDRDAKPRRPSLKQMAEVFDFLRSLHGEGDTRAPRPRIVCLCGSTRFRDEFMKANYERTMRGEIVLSVGFYMHTPEVVHGEKLGCTPDQKVALDELHKRKIDLCDYVLVLNVGGYIGSSTRSEIEYAEAHGKLVEYLKPLHGEGGEEAKLREFTRQARKHTPAPFPSEPDDLPDTIVACGRIGAPLHGEGEEGKR